MSHLRDHLEALAGAYEHAAEEYGRRSLRLHNTSLDPKTPFLEQERRSLIGDFGKTIQDCTAFLSKHTKNIGGGNLTFIRNTVWYAQGQNQLESLRTRMNQHVATMPFVTAPLQLGLLRNISETVHRIDKKVDVIMDTIEAMLNESQSRQQKMTKGSLPSPRLESKFRAALEKDPPCGWRATKAFPMDAGFRALFHSFQHSTRRSRLPETAVQSVPEHINLAKSRWLVQSLQESSEYDRAYYFKGAIMEIEQLIAQEYSRSDLTEWSDQDLLEQPESVYLIWAPEPAVAEGLAALDERILELTLPGGPPELERPDFILYRLSPHMVRLDRHRLLPGYATPSWYSEEINIETHHFIPRYTIFKATPFSVELAGLSARGGTQLDLAQKADVHHLQRAFTGFGVLGDKADVDIVVEKRGRLGMTSTLDGGRGRVQIWQWSDLPNSDFDAVDARPVESRFSTFSEAGATRITAKIDPSILSTIEDDDGMTTIYAHKPPLPAILMFVTGPHGYSMYHLERRSESFRLETQMLMSTS